MLGEPLGPRSSLPVPVASFPGIEPSGAMFLLFLGGLQPSLQPFTAITCELPPALDCCCFRCFFLVDMGPGPCSPLRVGWC